MQVYGEKSLLTSRLYINIGIVYEDNKDYVKAYEYFKKWASVSDLVLGPDHPKTLRAKGVLKEPRYKLVALRLKQQDENTQSNEEIADNSVDENTINQEVEDLDEYDDDHYSNMLGGDDERSDHDADLAPAVSELQELYQAFNDLLRRATLQQLENVGGDNRSAEDRMLQELMPDIDVHIENVNNEQARYENNEQQVVAGQENNDQEAMAGQENNEQEVMAGQENNEQQQAMAEQSNIQHSPSGQLNNQQSNNPQEEESSNT